MKQHVCFFLKQFMKMAAQSLVLPLCYRYFCIRKKYGNRDLVVFADAHHTVLPFSMISMCQAVRDLGYPVVFHLHDYTGEGTLKGFLYAVSFMKLYAKARFVFVCDNFLPVAACQKKKETTVVQLWHSCGLLKKMGYDTSADVPSFYRGNVYKNYDLVTVSAPCCVPCLTSGMRQPAGVVVSTGVSRTDCYFDRPWTEKCRNTFYKQHPDAAGKKVLLWAPTFRGNASAPFLEGLEDVRCLQKQLGEQWFVLIKAHPHVDKKERISNCSIPTEKLLPVTDLLITDYSSILFDYLFFQKPFVLFAPDLKYYEEERGFYIPYRTLTRHVVTEGEQLLEAVLEAYRGWEDGSDCGALRACLDYHNGSCDGNSTQRIIKLLKMRKNKNE